MKKILGLALLTFFASCSRPVPEPDVTLPKQAEVYTVDGKLVDLINDDDKVINFWASWCKPCVREFPQFEDAYRKHSETDFYMVNLNEDKEVIEDFLKDKEFTFPVYQDEGARVYKSFTKRTAIPLTVIVEDGNIKHFYFGTLPEGYLDRKLK